MVTIKTITDFLKDAVEKKIPLPPSKYLDAATKLSILIEDVDNALVDAKMAVAEQRARLIEDGKTASTAKILVEASPEYAVYLTLDAQRDRILQYVQICKKRVELKHWDQ
jgi:hypothetical protein